MDNSTTFVCICHGDVWATEANLMDHQVSYYSSKYHDLLYNYDILYNLIAQNYGNPEELAARERNLKRKEEDLARRERKLQKQRQQVLQSNLALQQQAIFLENQRQDLAVRERRWGHIVLPDQ